MTTGRKSRNVNTAHRHLTIQSREQWERYVQTRIDTTHDYDGEKAANAIALMPEFISDAIKLYSAMTEEPWE